MEWLAFRDAAFNAGRTIYPLTVVLSLQGERNAEIATLRSQ